MPRKKVEKPLEVSVVVGKLEEKVARLDDVEGQDIAPKEALARAFLLENEALKVRIATVVDMVESYQKNREKLYQEIEDKNFFKKMKILEIEARLLEGVLKR